MDLPPGTLDDPFEGSGVPFPLGKEPVEGGDEQQEQGGDQGIDRYTQRKAGMTPIPLYRA